MAVCGKVCEITYSVSQFIKASTVAKSLMSADLSSRGIAASEIYFYIQAHTHTHRTTNSPRVTDKNTFTPRQTGTLTQNTHSFCRNIVLKMAENEEQMRNQIIFKR